MGNLNALSAVDAAQQIAQGKITSEMLVRDCLARIAAREGEVHAWQALDPDAAIRQAQAIDAGARRGLLHGLPIAVKDVIDTVDMPTAYGSEIYAGHRPAWDAPCVAQTRAAGGIIMGKTVTTEFALMHPGPTRNPRNTGHTPGGSSSGSAAAVADNMVPLALGTQTAGSLIRPASYCGVVGYKPSFGMISRVGVKALSETLDTAGILARSVADAALYGAAITGHKELLIGDSVQLQPWVGICRSHEWTHAQPAMQQALEAAARVLNDAGIILKNITLPLQFGALAQAQIDIMLYELTRSLVHERLACKAQLSQRLRDMLDAGAAVTLDRYETAMHLAQACRAMLADVFADCDVLLTPSAPGGAPSGLTATGDPIFNRVWTLLHVPCVSLPVANTVDGLPLGLQVVGNCRSDVRTLAAAHRLYQLLVPHG